MNIKDTLYFDGACPLCTAEMKRLGRLSDDTLELVNIHEVNGENLPDDRDKLLEVLHLEMADGQALKGVDANVAAWQHTRFGFLFRWLRWPIVGWIADRVYGYWAANRYKRLYGGEKSPSG